MNTTGYKTSLSTSSSALFSKIIWHKIANFVEFSWKFWKYLCLRVLKSELWSDCPDFHLGWQFIVFLCSCFFPFQFRAALVQRWDLPAFMCQFCPFAQILSVSFFYRSFRWHMCPEGVLNWKKHPSFLLMPNVQKLRRNSKNISLKIGTWGPKKLSQIFNMPIIKSVPRKGQNTPKSDFRGPKIPPRGASSTWNM